MLGYLELIYSKPSEVQSNATQLSQSKLRQHKTKSLIKQQVALSVYVLSYPDILITKFYSRKKCSMQPYPVLAKTTTFKTVLICGIIAALLSATTRMSHTKLQCTDFYYKYCDLQDKDHYICYKHQEAYCCQSQQIEDQNRQLPIKHDQCLNLNNCEKMFISKQDRQCMEKLQFFEGVATFFYGVALVCFGGLIFLLFRHQRGREEWMQRMQQHQSYPANSIELQSLGEAPRRQEPHGNLSGDRVL